METCPCCSGNTYAICCEPIHGDVTLALTAEQLMRARYCAFCKGLIDFLYNTFHSTTRRWQQKKDIERWATENKWMQLEIVNVTRDTVEFRAHFLNKDLHVEIHHEKSYFKQVQGIWYYMDGNIVV